VRRSPAAATTGQAANNLALVLATRGQADAAVTLLEQMLQQRPEYEAAYLTLARIHLSVDHRQQGIRRAGSAAAAQPEPCRRLELLRQWKGRP
jgi:Tfp pilus assembly protein PilF